MAYDRLMVFSGSASRKLAEGVVRHLNIHLGRASVGMFSDGETMVELLENVRGKDVFVLQSTCSPANDNLMELMAMVDALKRSSAARVTAAGIRFGIEPHVRFKGEIGEQATMFFCDPSGNALEFKAFTDDANLFAR